MKLPLTLALDEANNNSARVFDDPPSILRDDKTGELFIIELQGQLEVEQDDHDHEQHSMHHPNAGQKIGKLDMSVPTRPTLLIGHHRLIGQIVKLNTPLAILRHTLPPKTATPSSSIPRPPPTSSPLQPSRLATATTLLGGDIPSSSPLKRDRSSSPAHEEEVDSESNSSKRVQVGSSINGNNLATPLPPRLAPKPSTHEKVPSSPFLAPPNVPSSAPSNRTITPSTPLNVSELKSGKHEILGILKSKIIFSKRPEPVVKLDEESEDE